MLRTDRFRLKSSIVQALQSSEWSFERTQLLFREFGIDGYDEDRFGQTAADLVAGIGDEDLIEFYSLATGVRLEDVESSVEESGEAGPWQSGFVRLFISHSARHKVLASEIAESLRVVGIDGFVAHDSMTVTKPWQAQIERALGSMELFVALVHPEFASSVWCQQEVGWALGRKVPRFAVRLGTDPGGFLGRDQWPSGSGESSQRIAARIASWASSLSGFDIAITRGLFEALRSASNFVDAGAAAKRVAALDSLTPRQFEELDAIWWQNGQLNGGSLATKAMRPFYLSNGRQWPPVKPTE